MAQSVQKEGNEGGKHVDNRACSTWRLGAGLAADNCCGRYEEGTEWPEGWAGGNTGLVQAVRPRPLVSSKVKALGRGEERKGYLVQAARPSVKKDKIMQAVRLRAKAAVQLGGCSPASASAALSSEWSLLQR
eukprot:1159528-Pelagomonas_calceolata.AAC.2